MNFAGLMKLMFIIPRKVRPSITGTMIQRIGYFVAVAIHPIIAKLTVQKYKLGEKRIGRESINGIRNIE